MIRGATSLVIAMLWLTANAWTNGRASTSTVCHLPSPTKHKKQEFQRMCNQYINLPYVCDSDNVLSQTGAEMIESKVKSYSSVIRVRHIGKAPTRLQRSSDKYAKETKCELGIILLKYLKVPFHNFSHYASSRSRSSCFVKASQFVLDHDSFSVLMNDTYFDTYLHHIIGSVRRRWFGNDCGNHVLMVVVTNAVVDSSTKQILSNKPYFIISSGKAAVKRLKADGIQQLRNMSTNLLQERHMSLPGGIGTVLDTLGKNLKSSGTKTNIRVIHSIPPWAMYSFIVCFGLISILVSLDWLIVRRKGLSLRGGNAPKPGGGDRMHTHMWF